MIGGGRSEWGGVNAKEKNGQEKGGNLIEWGPRTRHFHWGVMWGKRDKWEESPGGDREDGRGKGKFGNVGVCVGGRRSGGVKRGSLHESRESRERGKQKRGGGKRQGGEKAGKRIW